MLVCSYSPVARCAAAPRLHDRVTFVTPTPKDIVISQSVEARARKHTHADHTRTPLHTRTQTRLMLARTHARTHARAQGQM